MQTYSHYILTVWANRRLKKQEASAADSIQARPKTPPLHSKWLLFGSIFPDMPLTLLAVGFIAYDRYSGVEFGFGSEGESMTGYLFDVMFFETWWVKVLHNLGHAPLMVLAYMLIGYWAWKQKKAWGPALFWFGASCLFHTSIDIPIHYDDGPLLFFPFDFETRFYSPVSYWDPARYGRPFAIFEHLLVLVVLVYLVVDWWRQRQNSIEKPVSLL